MTDALIAAAAKARAAAAGGKRLGIPCDEPLRNDLKFASEMRAEQRERDGLTWYVVEGYASMYERGYDMWDMFGPYEEVVARGAADKTLRANPDVVYRFNHAGMPMARTTNGRLELWEDSTGLGDRAWLNPKRADVQDLIHAIEGRDVTEQSFMFRITEGEWSDDFSKFFIREYDLERGDVGPVTYGANPHTTVAMRTAELLSAIPNLSPPAARRAYELLRERVDDVLTVAAPETPAPTGRSVALLSRLLELDD